MKLSKGRVNKMPVLVNYSLRSALTKYSDASVFSPFTISGVRV